eukprot:c23196_g2_i6 orf=1514-1804(-)
MANLVVLTMLPHQRDRIPSCTPESCLLIRMPEEVTGVCSVQTKDINKNRKFGHIACIESKCNALGINKLKCYAMQQIISKCKYRHGPSCRTQAKTQ